MSSKSRQGDDQLDDLFNQMKPKQPKVSSDHSEDSDEDIKQVKKFGMDYYKILGVKRDASTQEIKKRYRHLIAKYHPDKLKDLSEKARKQKQENYMLIRIAGELLANPDKRKHYDLEQKVLRSKDYDSQKHGFDEFVKLQDSEVTEEKKKMAQLEFNRDVNMMNKMRGFDPDAAKDKLDKNETKQRLDDLMAQREIERLEAEAAKPNRFDGRSFSNDEFNKMFDKYKKKQEKKEKKLQENGQIVKYDDKFTAFNDTPGSNFVSVDADYGDIYGNDQFAGNGMFGKINNVSDDEGSDASSGSDIETGYYDGHNKDKVGVNKRYEDLMKQREEENAAYENMKYGDFKDVMHDPFGISKDFGTVIGKDTTGKSRRKQIDSKTAKIYNRMIKHDKNDDDSD